MVSGVGTFEAEAGVEGSMSSRLRQDCSILC